jgi:hypothetical protein
LPNQFIIFIIEDNGKASRKVKGGNVLRDNPVHQNQFACQAGESIETALQNVVTHIEN